MPERDQLQSVRSPMPQSSAVCLVVSNSGVIPAVGKSWGDVVGVSGFIGHPLGLLPRVRGCSRLQPV